MTIKNGINAAKEILDVARSSKIIFISVNPAIREETIMSDSYLFMKNVS